MPEPRVIFSHTSHPEAAHDLATPIATVIPCADVAGQPMLLMRTVGGLTKLEQVAAMVASAVGIGDDPHWSPTQRPRTNVEHVVDWAEAILAECAKRQATKEQPAGIEVAG